MSVAETQAKEPVQWNPQQQFAVCSAIGAAAVLAGLWVILAGLPKFWGDSWQAAFASHDDLRKNLFLSEALLILVELVVIAGLVFAAYRGLQQLVLPGVRSGIIFVAVMIFAALLIGAWVGTVMYDPRGGNATVGWIVLGGVVGGLLGGIGFLYLRAPGWYALMETAELQGWFHARAYKGNQGVRVRRGSIVGLLAVGVCGIITLSWRGSFGTERPDAPNDWFWLVPFSYAEEVQARTIIYVPLLFKVHLMAPILMFLALVWLAWRTVNVPAFADFLIATEAEMNKVSWTNRRRLVQDTVVVLVTVFLFAAYLFSVDVILIKVLSAPGIQVLLINPKDAEMEQQKTAEW